MPLPYFDEIEKRCGEMKLLIWDAMEMTPRQFQNYFEGFQESRESRERESWEQVRMLAYYAASGNLKKGTKPKGLMQFPWDDEPVIDDVVDEDGRSLEEQARDVKAFWDKIDQKRGQTNS
jgi:hypothetical protein